MVIVSLRCLDCGRKFRQQTHFLYCDLGTVDRKRAGEELPFSEFFVEGRVTCPQCGSEDRYTLAGSQYLRVLLTTLWWKIVPPRPAHWLEVAYFGSTDGRMMHPFELRAWLAEKVARSPRDVELRVRYGNALRSQGLYNEAEAEYRAALNIAPRQTEAMVNLVALMAQRGEREAALETVIRLADVKPKNAKQREHVGVAKDILNGRMSIDELEVYSPLVPARKK